MVKPQSSSQTLSLDASECSFEDLDLEDTEDHAYVYHGETATTSRTAEARCAPSAKAPVGAAVQQQQAAGGDPVEFVNLFRAQIEKSMALIEQEVVMLDRLERGGDEPLTPDNVDEVQRLLQVCCCVHVLYCAHGAGIVCCSVCELAMLNATDLAHDDAVLES